MNGIHLLFDNKTIARVLRVPTVETELFAHQNIEKIQELFTQFVGQETYHDKLSYLHSLDSESFELLLRTYFHIVDNSLFTSDLLRH
jgi:hypothetical protein